MSEPKPDLSVVIPAYNEELRLGSTLDAVGRYLRASAIRWELVVVDDGSTDGTAGLVRAAGRADRRIHLVRSSANRGKGHAVRTGVRASRGRQVLFSDADLATPIEELGRLRAVLGAGTDAAIGSRAHRASSIQVEQAAVRRLLGQAGNRLIRVLATPGIADTQCGFKLFDGAKARHAFGLATIDGWGFDVEILYLFARFGWTVEEVPVRWAHQPGSKLRPGAYPRVVRELLQLRREHGHRGSARAMTLAPPSTPLPAGSAVQMRRGR
ncbi:glycosyltransferase family 2 protein [Actinomadura vinacea]|uniref:dolichyl-phosphate beta-glucosyltransferase n=1 Tax=Actinomadura vinacea TaxID=115336 RepID=A0ABP5VTV6_9ACTN